MDIRSQITQIIEQIEPFDQKEVEHKLFVTEWINSGAGLFRIEKPATPRTHLISYFVPVDEANGKILLVHHKKANLWLPPGGHVDVNEHPRVAAAREMEEELFVQADFMMEEPLLLTVTDTVNDANSHTDVALWYLVRGDSNVLYTFDEREFYEVRWFSIEEIPSKMTEPHLSRFVNKYTNRYETCPFSEVKRRETLR